MAGVSIWHWIILLIPVVAAILIVRWAIRRSKR